MEILHEILALHNIKQFKQDQRLAFLTEIIVWESVLQAISQRLSSDWFIGPCIAMYSLDESPTVALKPTHVFYINPISANIGSDNLFVKCYY